jgi:hypothetical protein
MQENRKEKYRIRIRGEKTKMKGRVEIKKQ